LEYRPCQQSARSRHEFPARAGRACSACPVRARAQRNALRCLAHAPEAGSAALCRAFSTACVRACVRLLSQASVLTYGTIVAFIFYNIGWWACWVGEFMRQDEAEDREKSIVFTGAFECVQDNNATGACMCMRMCVAYMFMYVCVHTHIPGQHYLGNDGEIIDKCVCVCLCVCVCVFVSGKHYLGEEGEMIEMVLIARKDLDMPTGLGFTV